MRADKHVIDKARQLGKLIAINIGFGMNNGSHWGDSLFATYLPDIRMEWMNSIVIPSGNEGGGIESQVKTVHIGNLLLTIFYGQPSHYSISHEIYFNVKAITGVISSGLWKLRVIAVLPLAMAPCV